MKLYQIALFLLLVSFAYTDEIDCIDISNPTKKTDCIDKLSERDKTTLNYTHCCYQDIGQTKQCLPYTQEEYDDIGKTTSGNSLADNIVSSVVDIQCNAQYLTLGIISLLFFLL